MDEYASVNSTPISQKVDRGVYQKLKNLDQGIQAPKELILTPVASVATLLPESHSPEEELQTAFLGRTSEVHSTEALESNASVPELSVTTSSALDPQYIDDAATGSAPPHVDVEALNVETLVANNSLHDLDLMSRAEMSILETLSNEGKERIKLRLMRVWDAIAMRFESGETMAVKGKTIAGTGGKGIGAYLRFIGINPAKRRSWTFELKRKSMLMLAQEPIPVKERKDHEEPEIRIESQTEAMLLAKAGIQLARTINGDTMMSSAERSERAAKLSVQMLEAADSGNCSNLPESDDNPKAPTTARYEDWQNHQVDVPTFKLKYFQAAAENFKHGSSQALRGAAFMKILELLKNNPKQVSLYAGDFEKLAGVIESAALSLDLLKKVIRAALTAPTESNPTAGAGDAFAKAYCACTAFSWSELPETSNAGAELQLGRTRTRAVFN